MLSSRGAQCLSRSHGTKPIGFGGFPSVRFVKIALWVNHQGFNRPVDSFVHRCGGSGYICVRCPLNERGSCFMRFRFRLVG